MMENRQAKQNFLRYPGTLPDIKGEYHVSTEDSNESHDINKSPLVKMYER